MMKVKIITTKFMSMRPVEKFEAEINKFLSKKSINVKDIKLSIGPGVAVLSAMILYDE